MKRNTIIFLLALTIGLTSCNGQTTSRIPGIVTGEIVSELPHNIWVIFQDKNNNYWFGSNDRGVYRYDGKNTTHFTEKDGLPGDRILEIQEDKAGDIFLTTPDGICKFDGKKFTILKLAPGNNTDWQISPNDLWFKGGTKGPYRYDGKTLHQLKFPKHQLEDEYYTKFPGTTIDPYDIYYIYRDRKGSVWFGTGSMGLYQYDGKTLRCMYEDHLTNAPNGGSFGIRSIFEDSKGKFWICNTKYRYTILPGDSKEKGKGFINYTREKGISDIKAGNLGGDRIYFQSISEDDKGGIWLQTYKDGIWQYDGKKLVHHPVMNGKENVRVIAMYRDKNGGLWLATDGMGVYRFDGKKFMAFQP